VATMSLDLLMMLRAGKISPRAQHVRVSDTHISSTKRGVPGSLNLGGGLSILARIANAPTALDNVT
jgi:hypothetical protein